MVINAEKKLSSKQSHMKFIHNQMNGEWLLCLWDGAAIYSIESISKCMGFIKEGAFLRGINTLYKSQDKKISKKPGGIFFLQVLLNLRTFF